jgi:anaerobic selenocysteine-containing dehydrogenase
LLEPDVAAAPGALLLVGRRNAQTNNSWLHNLPLLTKGPARCVLEMHPADAAARGFAEGDRVQVRSAVASLEVAVHITTDVAPGVVVLPHGFSAGEAPLQAVAHARAVATGSVNANRLAAAGYVDVASGTVALNGFPVWCEPA